MGLLRDVAEVIGNPFDYALTQGTLTLGASVACASTPGMFEVHPYFALSGTGICALSSAYLLVKATRELSRGLEALSQAIDPLDGPRFDDCPKTADHHTNV